mmetsp:Transcript_17421/g.36409  ORF Transcript_17421/g.36409 Transcript_17421/m.36409 type:complete len:503 (-) Transcript_17421:1040-2548(-)
MFSKSSALFRSHVGKRVLRNAQQKTQQSQKRAMGGGGAYMQTNEFGERLGEAFGTVAWLWVFWRFKQDGKVLLGYEHPWDHGHSGGDIYETELRVQGLTHQFQVKKQSEEEMIANWDKFGDRAINPGEDDDDDDDDNYDNYDDNTGEETSNTTCTNNHEHCEGWAEMGECHDNPEFMLANCAKACDSCDNHMSRTTSGTRRETSATANDFLLRRTAKFGALQTADDHEYEQATLDTIQNMMEYFESKDYKSLPSNIKKNCKNDHELCSYWATIGECEKNMAFMKVGCAPVCQSCHLLDVANRCPELPDAVPALKEGDLNQIFERIVETAPGNRTTLTAKERRELVKLEMTEYTVTVHSRPNAVTNANANSISRDKKLDPWVIALDNFLTDEECDALIQHGYDAGYKRSEDVGALKFDGTYGSVQSTGRTSENAWCGVANECRGKTVPKRILNRMSSIMGIPTGNSEDFQILKYEVGQFYKVPKSGCLHFRDVIFCSFDLHRF